MKAILMAAGIGSRISRAVQKPKSLLDIDGTTIIRNTVQMLIDNDIDTAVVVGYKKEDIFDALKGLPVAYYFNPFFKVTNSMASLWFARDFIDEENDLILANADVYWEQPILDELLRDERRIVMLGDSSHILEGDYFFQINEGIVTAYGKELTPEERSCEYVGVAKLKNDFLENFKRMLEELVEKEVYNMWWENVLYEHCKDFSIYVKDISQYFWSEVDFIEDYERILNYIDKKK